MKRISDTNIGIDIEDTDATQCSDQGPLFFGNIQFPGLERDNHAKRFTASWIETPLGRMMAVGDDEALYLLEFADRYSVERITEQLIRAARVKTVVVFGTTGPIDSITQELHHYFNGTLTAFKTPVQGVGTAFQKRVWQELMMIPYGQTRSYKHQAQAIKHSTACRAVANANGANRCAIIIPCHRVINSDGGLGGYGGGIERKRWLIEHERRCAVSTPNR